MKRRFFVIGDIEMGGGDIMDDFHDDEALVKFVEHVGRCAVQGEPVDEVALILNGDIFDFLKMDYKDQYPRYITEDISLWKLEKVLKAHPKVFEAWAEFLKLPRTKLVFVIGNHDADVAWPAVQERLRQVLGQVRNSSKIHFGHTFDEAHFHVQHGNLIDPFFEFNHHKDIILHNGKKVLNLPFGYQLASQYLTPFKRKFYREEVLYPHHEVFKKYPYYKKAIYKLAFRQGLKVFFVDPLFHLGNPMYRVPYLNILRHVFKHGFNGVHDDQFLDVEKLPTKFGEKKLYVLSHAHVKGERTDEKSAKIKIRGKASKRGKIVVNGEGMASLGTNDNSRRYIFVDCWRTELNVTTSDLQRKPKTYVEIMLDGDTLLEANLKEFPI